MAILLNPWRKTKTKKYLDLGTNKQTKVKTKSKSKEESLLVKACIEYLMFKGYIAIRNNSGLIVLKDGNKSRAVKMGIAGASDIIACSPEGKFIAIECKSSKGKLTEKQKNFLKEVSLKGGEALVVKSIDELIDYIENRKK